MDLSRAILWISETFPREVLVLGGHFSTLKAEEVLRRHPEVRCIVVGEAEKSLPLVIDALIMKRKLGHIPNLAFRSEYQATITHTYTTEIDMDLCPAPAFQGKWQILPYESMRGCPFRCKFCSFPFGTSRWRYRSAQRIVKDWRKYYGYYDTHDQPLIRSMDSVLSEPRWRFEELLSLLSRETIRWEGYTRASTINGSTIVKKLEKANCDTLSIGFESMCDDVLRNMGKGISASQNRNATRLLAKSNVHLRASFMVGYPGEHLQDFQKTKDFLVNEFHGHYMINVFSLIDKSLPVWDDADAFGLEWTDRDDSGYHWQHSGMDDETAWTLLKETNDVVRWQSDHAILLLWQMGFEYPLIPHLPRAQHLYMEKMLERLGMLPRDFPNVEEGRRHLPPLLESLGRYGVYIDVKDAKRQKDNADVNEMVGSGKGRIS